MQDLLQIDYRMRSLMTHDTYAVGFAVRAEDKDAAVGQQDIAEAVQCDELAEYYKTEKQGTHDSIAGS